MTVLRILPLLALLIPALPVFAVSNGWSPPADAAVGDEDYIAGIAAWRNSDWPALIEHMNKVIERRPWDDNAHNLLGFGYRKQGDYEHALEHYREALELNPYHRGAMEYMGEAYLELEQPEQAAAMLEKLEQACRRVAKGIWQVECSEWQELMQAVDAYQTKPED